MNVESAVRESLEAIAGELTRPPRKGHHAAMQRGRRRRTVRRLGGSVLGLGVAYGFLLIPAAVTPSIVADGGETEVAVAMIPASVSGRAPGSEVVWLGEIGPEPQFDTSALGPDLSFDPVDPDVAALEALEGLGAWSERSPDKVVYLGELDGEPMFLFSVAPPSVLDLVFEYAFGNWSGRIYGTPLNCCGSIADIPPEGLPTFGSWRETIEGGLVESGGYLEWLALPPETSVVSLSAAGIDLGWQRPVGRAVMLPLGESFLGDDGLVQDPRLVAYAADGTVLAMSQLDDGTAQMPSPGTVELWLEGPPPEEKYTIEFDFSNGISDGVALGAEKWQPGRWLYRAWEGSVPVRVESHRAWDTTSDGIVKHGVGCDVNIPFKQDTGQRVVITWADNGVSCTATVEATGRFEGNDPALLEDVPQLDQLSITYQCDFGFWLGNQDDTVGLRLEYDRRAALDETFPPDEAVTLPNPDWDAYLLFGQNLYANWCSDTITDADPIPVETDRIPVTGGSITWVEAPAHDFALGPSTISIVGLEVTTSGGETVLLGDLTITNDNFGLSAN